MTKKLLGSPSCRSLAGHTTKVDSATTARRFSSRFICSVRPTMGTSVPTRCVGLVLHSGYGPHVGRSRFRSSRAARLSDTTLDSQGKRGPSCPIDVHEAHYTM